MQCGWKVSQKGTKSHTQYEFASRLLLLFLLIFGLLPSLSACNVRNPRSASPIPEQQDALIGVIRIEAGDMLERDIIPQFCQIFLLSEDEVKDELAAASSNLINQSLIGFRSMEGMIPPGEYEVRSEAALQEMISEWVAASEARVQRLLAAQPILNRLKQTEQLILASIVEAECLAGEHQAEVAAVLQNRLADAAQLQSCVTTEYALGFQRFYLTNDDIELVSEYNTYFVSGLPIGPICAVSDTALQAAMCLTTDPELYFFFYDYLQNEMLFFTNYTDFQREAAASWQHFVEDSEIDAAAQINKQELFH